jgi:hypothetical protein
MVAGPTGRRLRARIAGSVSVVLCCLAAMPFAGAPSARAADSDKEVALKAALIFQFLHFTQFPEQTEDRGGENIIIGVLGSSEMERALAPAVGREIAGRRIDVRPCRSVKDLTQCCVVYVALGAMEDAEETLRDAQRAGVLTVGEDEDFLSRGGIIRFVRTPTEDRGRGAYAINFEVNLRAAEHTGMQFRAKMLRVAHAVH